MSLFRDRVHEPEVGFRDRQYAEAPKVSPYIRARSRDLRPWSDRASVHVTAESSDVQNRHLIPDEFDKALIAQCPQRA